MTKNKLFVLLVLISTNTFANVSLDLSFIGDKSNHNSSEEECVKYERLNPAIYIMQINCKNSNYVLNFKELFHPGWKVYFSLKSSNDNSKLKYSINENYLSKKSVDDKKIYTIERNIKPTIDDSILLTDDLHFRLNDIFNGWFIDSELIEYLTDQSEVETSNENIQFTLYLVFYSEIIKQIWFRIMFLIIGLISIIFFIKKLLRIRSK
jgi:hypothetical protein